MGVESSWAASAALASRSSSPGTEACSSTKPVMKRQMAAQQPSRTASAR